MTPIPSFNTAALNAAFAERVMRWTIVERRKDGVMYGYPNSAPSYDVAELPPGLIPDFCASMDAVAPFAERLGFRAVSNRSGGTCASTVEVNHPECDGRTFVAQVSDLTTQAPLPHACVIALLRAHGVEVV